LTVPVAACRVRASGSRQIGGGERRRRRSVWPAAPHERARIPPLRGPGGLASLKQRRAPASSRLDRGRSLDACAGVLSAPSPRTD